MKSSNKINTLINAGNGYEFVSTYKIKNLSRKIKSKKSKSRKTKIKKRKHKQQGGSCQSDNNDYLLVNGVEIPESNHAPSLTIGDNYAKIIQETTMDENTVNHPNVQ